MATIDDVVGLTFTFSATDNVAGALTFRCSIDALAYANCTSPKTYTGLAAGPHTFSVRAIDSHGNVSAPAHGRLRRARHDRPEHGARRRAAGQHDLEPLRELRVRRLGRLRRGDRARLRVPPRRRRTGAGLRGLRQPAGLQRPRRRHVPLPGARGRRRGQRRPEPGEPHLERRRPAGHRASPRRRPPRRRSRPRRSGSPRTRPARPTSARSTAARTRRAPRRTTSRSRSRETAQQHTLSVRAKDPSGQVDATPASYTWTISAAARHDATRLGRARHGRRLSRPRATSATFTFSSPDSGETFECALDGGAMMPCTSPKSYTQPPGRRAQLRGPGRRRRR